VGPGTHCRVTARRPEWFPGDKGRRDGGWLLAGLAVQESVTLAAGRGLSRNVIDSAGPAAVAGGLNQEAC